MNIVQKTLAVTAVAAFGLALAPIASARSTIAFSGNPNPLTAANCFTESWGRVINNCSATQTWEISLPVDAVGSWTADVNVTPTSNTGALGCQAFSVDANGNNIGVSGSTVASTPNQAQMIRLNVSGVQGFLFVACSLPQGASFNTVNWWQ